MAEKTRVQFDFTPAALQELDKLQGTMGARSRAEVIRYALRVLQWLLEQMRNGNKILVETKDGKVQTIVFTFLNSSAAKEEESAAEEEKSVISSGRYSSAS